MNILSFFDTRKFGRLYLVKDINKLLYTLGPDPLNNDFDYKTVIPKMNKSSKNIKALLLDQSFISGIGNIYADEALWEAKINPKKIAKTMSTREIINIFKAITIVLEKGIKNKGTSLGKNSFNFSDIYHRFGSNQNHLNAYDQKDKQCKRCKTLIVKEKVAQRNSYFCPLCQK